MWSAQQQSMLNAMGYTLYMRPGSQPASLPSGNSSESLVPEATPDSALFKAVMKAARGNDISPLGIDLNALRTSPHAKRALWPQLRRIIKS